MTVEDIKEKISQAGFEISDLQAEKLFIYMNFLREWNEHTNLTAITEPEEIVEKHFIDSLQLMRATDCGGDIKLIDVGSGAGFPGVPVKVFCPDIELTILDSANKRLAFLKNLCEKLDIEAELIHMRAEEGGKMPKFREKFDIATARAVAGMNVLSEYCLPFVKNGGVFAALKGPAAEEELKFAEKAIDILGGRAKNIYKTVLQNAGERNILVIEKYKSTDKKYPRHGGTIKKSPL